MRRLNFGPLANAALVVTMLALGKPVLVPLALAFYLAFVLTPLAEVLERRLRVPRGLAVASVVGTALAAFLALGLVLVAQLSELAAQMHTYSAQISHKLAGIRDGGIGIVERFSSAVSQLTRALDPQAAPVDAAAPVRVVSARLSTFQFLEENLRPLLEPVAYLGIVLVLTIFVLARREDLRDRLIQLVGPQNVTLTTRTIHEAASRISHLLLTQAYINGGFGAVIAAGLSLIGIPYALLWGALAGLLRFVPLLGALIAVLLPSLIAFALFPGWRETLFTVGLFITAGALVGNFVEPMVLGRRTGVSSLALLISTIFWTWLWGPLGLVLATPLTVCAAVVGKHVPRLSFVTILLGDQPGLSVEVNFYQRLLAKATGDAQRLAKREVAKTSLPRAIDTVLVPALRLMARDQSQQAIDATVAERLVKDMGEILDRLRPRPAPSPIAVAPGAPLLLGIAAESTADALLLKMLSVVPGGPEAPIGILPVMARVAAADAAIAKSPSLVCIAALPPGGTANARFLCRRLRAALPNLHILVVMPSGADDHHPEAAARLREAGANEVAHSLQEAQSILKQKALVLRSGDS